MRYIKLFFLFIITYWIYFNIRIGMLFFRGISITPTGRHALVQLSFKDKKGTHGFGFKMPLK